MKPARGNRWGPAPWQPRFWSYVNQNGPLPEKRPELGPCWLWTGYVKPNGYASFYIWEAKGKGSKRYIHRIAYELVVGTIPARLTLDHLCERRHCCNPGHLEPVTQKVNVRRAVPVRQACPAGHKYTEENTWTEPGTDYYHCRTCHRNRQRERRARDRAARAA